MSDDDATTGLRRYRPSGRCGWPTLPLTVAAVAAAGALSLAYTGTLRALPTWAGLLLGPVLALAYASGLAWMATRAALWGRVRNGLAAPLLGALVGAGAVAGCFLLGGRTLPGAVWPWVVLLAETALLVGAPLLAAGAAVRRPYCERTGAWADHSDTMLVVASDGRLDVRLARARSVVDLLPDPPRAPEAGAPIEAWVLFRTPAGTGQVFVAIASGRLETGQASVGSGYLPLTGPELDALRRYTERVAGV